MAPVAESSAMTSPYPVAAKTLPPSTDRPPPDRAELASNSGVRSACHSTAPAVETAVRRARESSAKTRPSATTGAAATRFWRLLPPPMSTAQTSAGAAEKEPCGLSWRAVPARCGQPASTCAPGRLMAADWFSGPLGGASGFGFSSVGTEASRSVRRSNRSPCRITSGAQAEITATSITPKPILKSPCRIEIGPLPFCHFHCPPPSLQRAGPVLSTLERPRAACRQAP